MSSKKEYMLLALAGTIETAYPGENEGQLSRSQDTNSRSDHQTARRLCRDAYLILSLFPAEMRYSYYVGSKDRLRCRVDRRAGS